MNKMNKTALVHTVEDIAKALDLKKRRVQQLVQQGTLPRLTKGKYDLASCVRAYEQYIQNCSGSGNIDQNEAGILKLRLLKAQTEKMEFDLAVAKGDYVKCDEIEFKYSGLILAFRSKMLALPSKLARTVTMNGTDFAKTEQILEKEIHNALVELSSDEYEETGNPQELKA